MALEPRLKEQCDHVQRIAVALGTPTVRGFGPIARGNVAMVR